MGAGHDYLGAFNRYYELTDQGVEKKIKERVEHWRKQTEAVREQKKPAECMIRPHTSTSGAAYL